MKIPKHEAISIVTGDHPDWVLVTKEIDSKNRWSINMYGVFQNIRTLKYYDVGWEIPATEKYVLWRYCYLL